MPHAQSVAAVGVEDPVAAGAQPAHGVRAGDVGARVEAIGGRPIDEVLALVEPLAPRDNPSNLLAFSTLYLRVSELLAGLGVIEDVGPTPFTVVGRDGVRRDVTIEPVTPVASDAWDSGLPHRLAPTDAAWLHDQDETLWWTFLEDSATLFVQFNAVRGDATEVISEIRERTGRRRGARRDRPAP